MESLASLWLSQAEWETLTAHLEVLKLSHKDRECLSWASSEFPPRSPPFLLYSVTDAGATRLDASGLAMSLGVQ